MTDDVRNETATEKPAADDPADSSDAFGGYLRAHVVHVAVVVGLALYPFVYHVLTSTIAGFAINLPLAGTFELSLLADTFDVVLPRVQTMIVVLYVGLFAMSFDFISGYTGYLSFGHAMFYGVGAYLVVLTATDRVPLLPQDTPFMVLLLIGGLLAFGLALLVGAVSFRLTGVYFAMITLGFAEVAHVFIRNWDHVGSNPRDGAAIGGAMDHGFAIGIPFVDSLQWEISRIYGDEVTDLLGTGIDLSATDVSYYMIGLIVLASYFAMQRIIHSPFGKVMIAIRENEERARAIGYNTFWYKMIAFGISGFFAAIAGALFAGYRRSVAPENTFDLFHTADALLAAIIGGFGTLAGPLFGHLFHEGLEGVLSTEEHGLARYLRDTLPESVLEAGVGDATVLEAINVLIDGRAELYLGIVFILFVLYVPRGILGTLRERLGGTVAEQLPRRLRRYRNGGRNE